MGFFHLLSGASCMFIIVESDMALCTLVKKSLDRRFAVNLVPHYDDGYTSCPVIFLFFVSRCLSYLVTFSMLTPKPATGPSSCYILLPGDP